MAQEFFKRPANLFIPEGLVSIQTDQVLHLRNVMENGSAHNEIGGRVLFVGVKGCMEENYPVNEESYEVKMANHGCLNGPENGGLRESTNVRVTNITKEWYSACCFH
ncbi:unnamed protein product [Fraxinus pennsylvanica]|uniref:Uncharacterized protein n=1 Tax=Fraxinus pennsylvanica TaxID=56036 RepID=A0AAD1ZG58_9LAMI|nr:unnamed protein product [Fraxinus pennsylvanica]